MSKRSDRPIVEEGSGNVFADLGFANPEEELLKAQLARQVLTIMTNRGLTQVETAAILGIAQPNVSTLVNGRLAGFSVERLIRFLNALAVCRRERSEEDDKVRQAGVRSGNRLL